MPFLAVACHPGWSSATLADQQMSFLYSSLWFAENVLPCTRPILRIRTRRSQQIDREIEAVIFDVFSSIYESIVIVSGVPQDVFWPFGINCF